MQTFETISEAYLVVMASVVDNPEFRCSPRGREVFEQTDRVFQIDSPTDGPVVTHDVSRNKTLATYLKLEKRLYDSGTDDAAEFANISRFWDRIKNPDGTINSAYGKLIYRDCTCGNPKFDAHVQTPYSWALNALKEDRDTRQAYVRVARPDHLWTGNKDQVCTMHINFMIRDGRLNMAVVMRSNDLVKGFAYDAPWFVTVQLRMVRDLYEKYPELKIGYYRHFAHSLHVYGSDMDKVNKMLGR